jgi:hypothetical protein
VDQCHVARRGALDLQPRRDLVDRCELASAVLGPDPLEAAQLALQVAVGAAERGQLRARHVERVQLGERVDHPVGDANPAVRVVEQGRDRGGEHVAEDLGHHVERDAEHVGVLAHQ